MEVAWISRLPDGVDISVDTARKSGTDANNASACVT
jgi:hypothetical protein